MSKRVPTMAVAAFSFAMSGCGTPSLDAGGKLAQALESGTSILSKGVESRAATIRQYMVLNPRAPQPAGGTLPAKFVALVCAQYDSALVSETIALGNLQAYGASVKASTTPPKETDLGSVLLRMTSAQSLANLPSVEKPADELRRKLSEKFAACVQEVKRIFVTPAGAPPVGVIVAVYPKVKELLTLLASQADKKAREERFKAILLDDGYQRSFSESLDALEKSGKTGQLSLYLMQQRQLTLWSAYVHYLAVESAGAAAAYPELAKNASAMSDDMATFDKLYQTDLAETVASLRKSNATLVAAAKTGQLDVGSGATSIKELLDALDFLVAVAEKYNAAQDAFDKAKKN